MITDFLKTRRSIDELSLALDVLNEFKECESQKEYLEIPFYAWAKFEQLEEFLLYLVEGKPLAKDTIEYIANGEERCKKIKS